MTLSACRFVAGFTLLVAGGALMPGWAHAQCESPKTAAERVACVGQELRQSDDEINAVYKELMAKLTPEGKAQLRAEQRAWLKKRTSACVLNDQETDRERWLAQILKDYATTVCVVRWTNQRIAELAAYRPAAEDNTRALPEAEDYAADDSDEYQLFSSVERSSGKWYFEVWFDKAKIAATAEAAIWVEVSADQSAGDFVTIRKRDRGAEPLTVGVAVDLDNGMVYTRENGEWGDTVPGSSSGIDIRLNRSYKAGIDSSVALPDLLKHGLVRVNFGREPFRYAMPDGYRPFQEQ